VQREGVAPTPGRPSSRRLEEGVAQPSAHSAQRTAWELPDRGEGGRVHAHVQPAAAGCRAGGVGGADAHLHEQSRTHAYTIDEDEAARHFSTSRPAPKPSIFIVFRPPDRHLAKTTLDKLKIRTKSARPLHCVRHANPPCRAGKGQLQSAKRSASPEWE
jgi:hypothetical protein